MEFKVDGQAWIIHGPGETLVVNGGFEEASAARSKLIDEAIAKEPGRGWVIEPQDWTIEAATLISEVISNVFG